MNEIVIIILGCVAGVLLGMFLLNIIMFDKKLKQIPLFISIGVIPAIFTLVGVISFYKTKDTSHHKLVRSLEVVDTVYPGYVYGLNKYTISLDGEEFPIDTIQGYTTDSAAVKDGVVIYRKVRKPIWGFVKGDYGDEYMYSLAITGKIARGLKVAEEVELKEE